MRAPEAARVYLDYKMIPCNLGRAMPSDSDFFCLPVLAKHLSNCSKAIDPQAIEADYLWPLQGFQPAVFVN